MNAAVSAARADVADAAARQASAEISLAGALDLGFLAMAGWDPAGQVLVPPASHRLLRDGSGPGPVAAAVSPGGDCVAAGCPRQVTAPGRDLCREHRRRQRISGDLPLEQFLASPRRLPVAGDRPVSRAVVP